MTKHAIGSILAGVVAFVAAFLGTGWFISRNASAQPVTKISYELAVVTCSRLDTPCTAELQKYAADGWEVKAMDATLFPLEDWKTRVILQRQKK